MLTLRQKIICSHLPQAESFADVGCDHGYMAQYMLEQTNCVRVYITDVSAKCLKKAEQLLQSHVISGRCIPVCCDGLLGLSTLPQCVLIAGMGGEEIVKILAEGGIPKQFVLQPMKNSEKVRAFLIERGCKITLDYTFEDGKYYDLIKGENCGGDSYSDFELLFGRDNLQSPSTAFLNKIRNEAQKLRALLQGSTLCGESRDELRTRLYRLEEIIDAVDEIL